MGTAQALEAILEVSDHNHRLLHVLLRMQGFELKQIEQILVAHEDDDEIESACLKSHAGLATKSDLKKMETRIMSAISDYSTKQNAHNDRIDAAVTGLQTDVKTLNDLIEKLQTTPGPISPEDQASLDSLEARGDAIAAKLEALDALTPPPVPA